MGFNLLLEYSMVIPHFISSGFVTTRRLIQQKPLVVENCVKALLDAVRYVFSNEQGTVKVIGRYMKISDQPFLREYYREVLVKELDKTLYPNVNAIDFVLEQERKTPAAAKAKADDFVDRRFLDKLKKEGY